MGEHLDLAAEKRGWGCQSERCLIGFLWDMPERESRLRRAASAGFLLRSATRHILKGPLPGMVESSGQED